MSLILLLSSLFINSSPNLTQQISPLVAVINNQVSEERVSNGKDLLDKAVISYQQEQYAPALKMFQQADVAFQSSGDKLNQALALNYLSLTYQQLGQLADAQQATDESLQLLNNKSDSKDYLSILAQTLNTQGQLQLAKGETEKALTSWQEASNTYSKIGDEIGKLGSKINQAQALQTLGLYRRANNTLEEIKLILDKQADSLLKVTGLLSLGNTLRVVGHADKSRSILTESCQIQAKLLKLETVCNPTLSASLNNTNTGKPNPEQEKLAEILLSLGNTAQAQQDIEAAIRFYERSASISQKQTTQLQANLNQLRLLIQSGEDKFLLTQGLPQEIISQIANLSAKIENLPASRSNIYARINFAQMLLRLAKTGLFAKDIIAQNPQNNCTSADSLCNAAKIVATGFQQAETLADVRSQAYALGTLGSLYEYTQQWTEARTLTQQALKLAEGIQARDIAYRWQWQLGRILSATGNPEENQQGAIAAYDRAVKSLKSIRRDLVTVNRDAQFSFRDEVEPVYREYVSLLLPKTGEPSAENLDKARKVIESLQLAELDNFFRSACLDTKPVEIDEIDTQKQTAVIYPVLLSDRLSIILSLPHQQKNKSLKLHTVILAKQEFQTQVKKLQQEIFLKSPREFLKTSKQIYEWLIRPIEADLANSGVKNIVFVLDGNLQSIPISALYDQQKKQYLIQKSYNIAITPGLELLPPKAVSQNRLQALIGGLSEARDTFPAIPGVKNELEQIKDILTTRGNFINENFTQQKIEDAVKSFPGGILHLATHGKFSSKAEETFILTWNQRLNVNDFSSVLKTRESKQQAAIDLLVLSACETATGDSRAALGIAGIAVQSGARSTLATLWTVNDEATSALMIEFYKQIAQNQKKAEALRNAQLILLSGKLNPVFKHPYYWAPFVLVGNWQ
ncbi:CHAT domain-containing protein [Calothrix sp. FACHB-1219]|uniref:CHAT domain-containing protein n=1 Tax=unclassified Calothrix TaxID=2619626 RepID=UPI001689D764|nr:MULTISPECIES: CHAT domain-containing protein [unclassified Calothrix]MBD2203116.1 CHAT domain-containing protein [Calothrix sp. FACHB-168]MBD2218717.1 CHAT domain-containing protein [Calothrix sp. FACHB-1219]